MTTEIQVTEEVTMPSSEQIARVVHEANRAYQLVLGEPVSPPWDDAPEWMRESTVTGVEFVIMDDPEPEAQHRLWMTTRELDGWVYGPVKDEVSKTHPCLVAYSALPAAQRAKDVLLREIVRALRHGLVGEAAAS